MTLGLLLGLTGGVRADDFMYWTDQDTGEIRRASLDGTGQVIVVSGQGVGLTGIALDVAAGQMYWTNQGNSFIRRANLDGTGQQTLLSGAIAPFGLALDLAAGQMYWTDTGLQQDVRRGNLDGTGQLFLVPSQPDAPTGIALDVAAGKMYWASQFGHTIWQANLNGTGQRAVLTGLPEPSGIALDLAAGKIYWTDVQGGIRRSNLDGSGVETLVAGAFGDFGIALDLVAGKVFWTNFNSDLIRRANLDGTGEETLISGLTFPAEIALQVGATAVPEPSTAVLFVLGVLIMSSSGCSWRHRIWTSERAFRRPTSTASKAVFGSRHAP